MTRFGRKVVKSSDWKVRKVVEHDTGRKMEPRLEGEKRRGQKYPLWKRRDRNQVSWSEEAGARQKRY